MYWWKWYFFYLKKVVNSNNCVNANFLLTGYAPANTFEARQDTLERRAEDRNLCLDRPDHFLAWAILKSNFHRGSHRSSRHPYLAFDIHCAVDLVPLAASIYHVPSSAHYSVNPAQVHSSKRYGLEPVLPTARRTIKVQDMGWRFTGPRPKVRTLQALP